MFVQSLRRAFGVKRDDGKQQVESLEGFDGNKRRGNLRRVSRCL